MKYFSTNVKYLRERSAYTQAEIEASTGIERTTWGNYERGKSFPNLKLFHTIAKYFGVSESDLLNVDLKENPEKLRPTLRPTLSPSKHTVQKLSPTLSPTERSVLKRPNSPPVDQPEYNVANEPVTTYGKQEDPQIIWRDNYIKLLESKVFNSDALKESVSTLQVRVSALQELLVTHMAGEFQRDDGPPSKEELSAVLHTFEHHFQQLEKDIAVSVGT